jgi:hypothetical protein
MEPDIHIRRLEKSFRFKPDMDMWEYFTLCGIWVKHERTAWAVLGRVPTCMGCILVRFQERAER